MNKNYVIVAVLLALLPGAFAHCDTMDGPVVAAARQALETGNINHVLVWVQPDDEPEVQEAFERAMHAKDAQRATVELEFFETLVRVHREGEGAQYDGLKPAGQVEPIVALSDRAIAQGNVDVVLSPLMQAMQHGIRERYSELEARSDYATDDVAAGREYVASYVTFMHYVEGIDKSVHASGHEHGAALAEHGGEEHPVAHAAVSDDGHESHDAHPQFVTYAGWAAAALVGASAAVLVTRRQKKR